MSGAVAALGRLLILFLLRCTKRREGNLRSSRWYRQPIVTMGTGALVFFRFAPFWRDESVTRSGEHWNRPPWWRPFNVLLHCWLSSDAAEMHDHPRWSVTVCLRGRIIECTPWWRRELRPGAVVFRTHRAIHRFEVPPGQGGRTWTMFIVGRRRIGYRQSVFIVKKKGLQTTHQAELEPVT